ncbi:1-acyl-sn-glycerol-3-phosphate acyltransferase [Desulfocicer vacuolatum DSM 3385]|uniref:1-acyl-sn-glycerol-3-phosphate acyltransferase n=2 Tax=Desulfocicer vacuolatum TaxID=2298 RepID=A0A1W2BJ01_9BACT|nr:acyltransferase [Desulfocicer vacuolatum]SMC72866.1 1-acyl-sn-glycerol-3-phosphate acyltransferase [Desulfocicer vacuolatum DSM 3385]
MLNFLPGPLKGILSFLCYLINTMVMCTMLFTVALVKFTVPLASCRILCDKWLIAVATAWISVNIFHSRIFNRIEWDVRGVDTLEMQEWYLVLSNHQSWMDILVLHTVFNRKIPFLKFFLKKELIWVPILGLAWWALDFPFMRRYTRKFLEKHPHLKGKDLESTRNACEKFKALPISIMNFVEGTRFTSAKHETQNSPYQHLLKPRAGGVAFVLGAMGEHLNAVIDVTIVYPQGADNFWGFMSGRVKKIIVDVEVMPVSETMMGDFFNDADFREQFCCWLNGLWQRKDAKIQDILGETGNIGDPVSPQVCFKRKCPENRPG